MAYRFTRNYFTPKKPGIEYNEDTFQKTHVVSYGRCNFRCEYCHFSYRNFDHYLEYGTDDFCDAIDSLMLSGNIFKFTGGEPTLNPRLYDDVKFVHDRGGIVYLDTNGSIPGKVEPLLKDGFIDTLGVSFKGLTPEKALAAAQIKNKRLCWDNVFETISLGVKYRVRTIVTYVFYNDNNMDDLLQFAELLTPYPNVYLKVNNWFYYAHIHGGSGSVCPIDSVKMQNMMENFVAHHAEWHGRVIYCPDHSAAPEYDHIQFL